MVCTPHWKGIADFTYRQGPTTVNWQVRYVGKGALFNVDPTSVDRSEALNDPYAKAVFYHDITSAASSSPGSVTVSRKRRVSRLRGGPSGRPFSFADCRLDFVNRSG